MRIVDTTVGIDALRDRAMQLAHSATSLTSGLEPGEVLLIGSGDDLWTACVTDIEFEPTDTVYQVTLGGRVPADIARGLAAGLPVLKDASYVDAADVVGMLGELRGSSVPQQRAPYADDPAAVAGH